MSYFGCVLPSIACPGGVGADVKHESTHLICKVVGIN